MQGTEVLSQIYHAIVKTPEFALKNGMKCRVDPFFEPEVDSDGDLKCGFDVLTEDGGHLEFTVGRRGWGKSLAMTEAQKANRKRSGRRPYPRLSDRDTDREFSADFDRQASATDSVSFLRLSPPKATKPSPSLFRYTDE